MNYLKSLENAWEELEEVNYRLNELEQDKNIDKIAFLTLSLILLIGIVIGKTL